MSMLAQEELMVSIAVGLAGFACVLLLVMFVLINKYGRRSKFGMKVMDAVNAGPGTAWLPFRSGSVVIPSNSTRSWWLQLMSTGVVHFGLRSFCGLYCWICMSVGGTLVAVVPRAR
ncbi:hypothetical protein AOLI_G00056010 [Acnodon oligacanthus]